LTADTLTESLAEEALELNDMKAIVARIARMTIVTISSTRVKAPLEFRIRNSEFNFLVDELMRE
jgi:hypothetical protein